MSNNRLVNFCHPKLCSTVSCSTCCSESYEETNLLSADPSKSRRGFMADRFIKPPVQVQVVFKYPVNLTSILLWPRVGQQKSTGFEIVSNFRDGTSAKNERISSCYLSERDEGVLFFCPRKFGKGKSNDNFSEQPNFVKRPFSWQKMSAISDVQSISIKIVRTNSSSVPALGKIEIWGQPGFHTTIQEKEEIRSLWEQRHNEIKAQCLQVSELFLPSQVSSTSKESTSTAKFLDIPEEFLDGLTVEMMSLPMVLPSGKVVDQKTLERHENSEANWGRPPSDPFTGRPFTASLHPILDTALKSRIDRYLVVHQDKEELQSVPRTLGRRKISLSTAQNKVNTKAQIQKGKPEVPNSQNKRLFSVSYQKHNLSQVSSYVSDATSSARVNDLISSKNSRPTSNVKNSTEKKSVKRAFSPDVTITSEKILPIKCSRVESIRPASAGNISRSDPSRYQTDDDLDDAMKAVLKGLPSFVNVKNTPKTLENCCNCESGGNLFRLPCNHLVCRGCLIEKTTSARLSCYICFLNFTSDQPVRYHPEV